MRIDIQAGDQVFIRGDKRSGKSTVCMAYALAEPLIVFDPKGTEEWPFYARKTGAVVTRDPADILRHRRVVLLVDQLWLDDREGWKRPGSEGYQWTQALDNAWQRGNSMVVFEEAMMTLPSNGANSRARRIMTQGRTKRLTSLIPIQVTNWVDTLGPRLSEHYLSFVCNDDDELGRIKGFRSCETSALRQLGPHAFAYHARGAKEWVVCPPLPGDLVSRLTGNSGMKKGVEVSPTEIAEEPETP